MLPRAFVCSCFDLGTFMNASDMQLPGTWDSRHAKSVYKQQPRHYMSYRQIVAVSSTSM